MLVSMTHLLPNTAYTSAQAVIAMWSIWLLCKLRESCMAHAGFDDTPTSKHGLHVSASIYRDVVNMVIVQFSRVVCGACWFR